MVLPRIIRYRLPQVPTPIDDDDIANKSYVDGLVLSSAIQTVTSTGNFTTTSSVLVDVTDITLTIPNTAGRNCMVSLSSSAQNSLTNQIHTTISDDGVKVRENTTRASTNSFPHVVGGLTIVMALDGSVMNMQARREAGGTLTIIGTGDALTGLDIYEL